MTGNYILKDGKPVLEEDILKWAKWYESADRVLACEERGHIRVSTVFLAVDHNFYGSDQPVLWETLVFGGELDGEMDRYSSEEEAIAGHRAMVNRAWPEVYNQ